MDNIFRIDTVNEYCDFFGVTPLHPLVSVAAFEDFGTFPGGTMESNLYIIMFKELHCGELRYGRSKYDYQAGTLLFMAPGQTLGLNGRTADMPVSKGYALVFHPDFLYGTPLARLIKDYSFFSYDVSEALHMSDREKATIFNCISEIRTELSGNIDRHTKQIVASYIETMLNHCTRFYERQFITREVSNRSTLGRLDRVLNEYFDRGLQEQIGIPTVQYCAGEVCLSPNYFGDLVKRETGRTATEYIRNFVIDRVKTLLSEGEKNISEIAYELGFRYPHHMTRVFKKVTGVTPNEYRVSCN